MCIRDSLESRTVAVWIDHATALQASQIAPKQPIDCKTPAAFGVHRKGWNRHRRNRKTLPTAWPEKAPIWARWRLQGDYLATYFQSSGTNPGTNFGTNPERLPKTDFRSTQSRYTDNSLFTGTIRKNKSNKIQKKIIQPLLEAELIEPTHP